jgi:hypothetical protein
MLSSSLCATTVALVAYAATVFAAPTVSNALSLAVETSTSIANTGGKTLRLLNDLRGVLSTLPENLFTIADTSGSRPSSNDVTVSHLSGYMINLRVNAFGLQF